MNLTLGYGGRIVLRGEAVGMKKIACMVVLIGMASTAWAALTTTTTSISSSLNPSAYGQSVTFTATVTSAQGAPPDGETITFLQGANPLGTSPLSGGTATFAISTLGGGTDSIKASYGGDSTFGPSKSKPVAQVVNLAMTTTTLSSSPNPANPGQTVVFTASVAGQVGGTAISGNVVFYNGSKKLGSGTISGGVATFRNAKLPVGTDPITALYNGSKTYSKSTSNVVNQVIANAQVIDSTLVWNGITRYYEVYIPATVSANPAMLLMLHGTQNKPEPQPIIALNWGWQSVADDNGFILVKPASTFNSKSGQWNWDAYFMDSAFLQPPDDPGFLRQLIVNLTAQYNVNPKQVYVAGFSSGAQMAHRVAVELSDLVAAVVIGSGTIVGQLDPPPISMPGPEVAPVSIQEWHGTEDPTIPPCNNGTTVYSGVRFYLATVDDGFNYWTQQNSCSSFQNNMPLCKNQAPNPGTTGNDATACVNNTEVQFIWEEGVAHSWVNAQDAVRWQFLAAHPKP
jgi:poly(3-hydroxybutyrate) depolymerase